MVKILVIVIYCTYVGEMEIAWKMTIAERARSPGGEQGNAVENRIKEPRFFLGSLNRFLRNWLVLSSQPVRFLERFLYSSLSQTVGGIPIGDKV